MKIENICIKINRKIYTMDYKIEKSIREFLEGEADENNNVEPTEYVVKEIALILDTNTDCINDLFGLNEN